MLITPNGAILLFSKAYGGHTSDVHIVHTSRSLEIIQSYDQIMANQGFKIKTDLTMSQYTLAISPSAACGAQMTNSQTKLTSAVANCRVYVEQAIKKLKDITTIKEEIHLPYLPIGDDIIKVCAALTNLKRPLKSLAFVRRIHFSPI